MTNLEFYKEDIKRKLCDFTFNRAIREVLNDDYAIDEYKLLDWLCEEHSILDKEEKEYMSNVVKPFRKRIINISKIVDRYDENSRLESIQIVLRQPINNELFDYVELPYFKKGTMYKGMKLNKEYTLKELGL